jgi:transposase
MNDRLYNRCPVCRASFRENVRCPRCGADLTAVMTLAARAYVLRQQSRLALANGDWRRAYVMAQQARDLQTTPKGEQLFLLAAWCLSHAERDAG